MFARGVGFWAGSVGPKLPLVMASRRRQSCIEVWETQVWLDEDDRISETMQHQVDGSWSGALSEVGEMCLVTSSERSIVFECVIGNENKFKQLEKLASRPSTFNVMCLDNEETYVGLVKSYVKALEAEAKRSLALEQV
ncbi:unnamed protein product [Peronospora destructor]|uniref:Uncharacterized protein n=1 Tax=Peronospora destructor TaxID=86335 RepID=A0AAV0V7U7_9STRA|nr:unnamed protein product [Peronospora destructor]